MNIRRTIVTGTLLGVALTFGALSPAAAAAAAADNTEVTTVRPVPMSDVSGEPWSAPAYPVDCQSANGQVSCTPSDPNSVTAQQCFVGVVTSSGNATVCTTFEGHTKAIQNAGGRSLLVKYGCSLGDAVCATFENAGRGMALGATGMMFLVADNMRFDTSTLLWDAAVGEWSFWQWAILFITFGAMVWAIAAAVISGDRGELVGAIVRTFIAIPAVPITLWATGHLLNAIDEMTWYIMNRAGPDALFSTLQSVMWAGGQANYFFAFLIHGLLLLGMFLLMLVFAFRNIVLAALIMVGPVAWMMFPVRRIGPDWVVRYVSAVAVLLLTGPLTIGFVTLIINGLAGVKTIWDPQSWPMLVGLVLVAFAPFAIFGLFSFVGAVAADGVGSRLGSHGGRMAGSAATSAVRIPTRMGGHPSGVRPTGTGPATASHPATTSRTSSVASRGAPAASQARTPAPPVGGQPPSSPRTPAPASTTAPASSSPASPSDRRPS
ncbi:hypothetical protein [Microbacterium trichothecenolyticum]|uniref:TrbL/VirB6 plasmid conjugal transfer protein n=1 Tax=Microbacterium trichothecenolyticum TaxID=69370 RepID=A0A0M2H7J9_MICTR|nr:hypothetical protein [Microbacterium trichothecenolyticum]KJL42365.1 hypothetical protein RS82_02381 [Microbacterium trichothecenolyticum]